MLGKRSQVAEELVLTTKRTRVSKDINSPSLVENNVLEQKKKIEAAWNKAKVKNQNPKEINFKLEIQLIKKGSYDCS